MARLTTSCSIAPFKQPISLSSFQSKLSHLHLYFPNSSIFRGCRITCRYGRGWGGRGYSRQEDPINPESDIDPALDIDKIRSTTVRLFHEEDNMVGVVSKRAAIQMAEDAEVFLVILSSEADPPVVKLVMDYTLFKFQQQKKNREKKRRISAHRQDQKVLKMGYNIDEHDYSVRLRAGEKFIKDGYKVKLIVNLRGRENEFKKNAIELIQRFRADVGELAVEESKNFRDRNMTLVLIPNKAVLLETPEKSQEEKSTGTEVSLSVLVSVSP